MVQQPLHSRWLFWQELIEQVLAAVVLLVLLLYTYCFFILNPYTGVIYGSTGHVSTAHSQTGVRVGDQLVQVGEVTWADYQADPWLTLFDQSQPGDVIPTRVIRDGQLLDIEWIFPGFTWREFWIGRFSSQWFIPYFFWGAGLLTLLVLRPRDERQRLFLAFNFLTALWLMASLLSSTHLWGSPFVLHTAMWLTIPIYWHLHWVFPQPLRDTPLRLWAILFALAVALAVADGWQILPTNTYLSGLLLALAGSFGLMVAHFIFRPTQRRDIFILLLGASLAMLPLLGLGLVALIFPNMAMLAAGSVLALPILPVTYLYIILRRRLAGLEIRVNRYLSLYIFLLLLSAVIVLPAAVADARFNFVGDTPLIILAAIIASVLLTRQTFHGIERFVEQRLLGVPVLPGHFLETYTARIINALDRDTLLQVLQHHLLPSLLVRQSLLLRLDDVPRLTVLYRSEVQDADLPTASELAVLEAQAGQLRLPPSIRETPLVCPWVRVVLPLRLSDQPLALWLLGRRDPDDYYSPEEIRLLQTIASQTAIALAHIEQTEHLRALHQTNIDRQETERTDLAHELHDEVLNELGLLSVSVLSLDVAEAPQFYRRLQRINDRLRHVITGLRPTVLDFGLRVALNGLADELVERSKNGLEVRIDTPHSEARYPATVERHIYRILQQAGNNVVRHARARTLRFRGWLELERIDISVEDDGVGFGSGEQLNLPVFLANKHFGLTGMYERAAIIGARVFINSEPGQGTRVRVVWEQPVNAEAPRSLK